MIGKKLAFKFSMYIFEYRPLPPLRPPRVYSCDECSQALPVIIFVNLSIPCIIVNVNRRSKQGRPGTEATDKPLGLNLRRQDYSTCDADTHLTNWLSVLVGQMLVPQSYEFPIAVEWGSSFEPREWPIPLAGRCLWGIEY